MSRHQASRLSRREFLAQAAAVAASAATTQIAAGAETTKPAAGGDAIAELVKRVQRRTDPPKEARVVVVTDRRVLDAAHRTDAAILRRMLQKALVSLSGADDAPAAWRRYFRKDDFVAIKYNEIGGAAIETNPALRTTVTQALTRHVGIDADKVVHIGRCTKYRGKYRGWGKTYPIRTTDHTTSFSSVFETHATAVCNLPVCKTHQARGVTCALKNHLGSVKNPYMFCGDDDWPRLWKNLPELNTLPPIKKKTRLIVVDALRPQYDKGPTHDPRHRFSHCSLIVTTDPVAADATALKIIERARKSKMKDWRMPYARKMLAFAQALGVGVADEKKIRVTRIDLTGKSG